MIAGEPLKDMYPWYKNYKGSIEPLDHQRYVVNGEIATLSDSKVRLNEWLDVVNICFFIKLKGS